MDPAVMIVSVVLGLCGIAVIAVACAAQVGKATTILCGIMVAAAVAAFIALVAVPNVKYRAAREAAFKTYHHYYDGGRE